LYNNGSKSVFGYTIQLHIHLILNTMVRLTISCTIWLMAPKSYFKTTWWKLLVFSPNGAYICYFKR
jgi:hypothetical protein